jgi:hypothetical protein
MNLKSIGWVVLRDDGELVRPLVGPSYAKHPSPAKVYRTEGKARQYGARVAEIFMKETA